MSPSHPLAFAPRLGRPPLKRFRRPAASRHRGVTGYACAFNSNGDIEIFMKATGAPGMHFIDLYPGIFKGTETRPNNFRIPQLTYADDHPGEDLPAFHFAFEVTPAEPAN